MRASGERSSQPLTRYLDGLNFPSDLDAPSLEFGYCLGRMGSLKANNPSGQRVVAVACSVGWASKPETSVRGDPSPDITAGRGTHAKLAHNRHELQIGSPLGFAALVGEAKALGCSSTVRATLGQGSDDQARRLRPIKSATPLGFLVADLGRTFGLNRLIRTRIPQTRRPRTVPASEVEPLRPDRPA